MGSYLKMAKRKKKYYYYKKKFKGVRYVSNALGKYFKKRYPKYKDRLARARVIHSQIKVNGEKVILANIFSKERHKRVVKAKDLFFPNDLLDTTIFFSLDDYVELIRQSDSRIIFESTIFKEDLPEVRGGKAPSYQKCFSSFVSYCNKLLGESTSGEATSDDIYWYVKTLPPVKKGKEYVMEIVACDREGEIDEENFGFDPSVDSTIKNFSKTFTSDGETKENKSEEEIILTEKHQYALRQKELEIEKINAESRLEFTKAFNNLSWQYKEGLITKSEFKDMLKKLK